MLGIQYPRTLPDPNLPASPESIPRRTPPSRERLGLRSLLHSTRSPCARTGSSHTLRRQEQEVERAMSGAYGSIQPAQSLSQYGNGTYASAMAGISSQKSLSGHTSSWSSMPSNATYQTSQTSLPASQGQSRAASPEFETHPSFGSDAYNKSAASNSNIHPYLQLPPTISPDGGSISEFAAQATCLFWFESSSTLLTIEDTSHGPPCRTIMAAEALPATGFTKWVTTILSTTQVTQNVILLALLFVHRLKKQNPTVKGKLGSEYRLLTVALMLGNKFLDDNTYTNKTWAEVSGISVTEIHVMEVEFLSHMKYNLYTSKEEWNDWHKQLAHLWRFFTAKSPMPGHSRPGQQFSYKPTLQIPQIPKTLPSPPSSNNASSPSYPMSNSPTYPTYGNGAPILPQPVPSHVSPVHSVPPLEYPYTRKRSYDDAAHGVEPPAKRQFNYEAYQATRASTPSATLPTHSQGPQLANLPIPTLPMPGQQQRHSAYSQAPTPASSGSVHVHQLPPVGTWQQHPASQAADPRVLPALQVATGTHFDRSRHQTPYGPMSRHASPVAPNYPNSATAHSASHAQLSPSYFLHQRSSPYRPVRNISTLLVPPPSGQLRNPPQQLADEQMYWQPIGRQTATKTGRVPYDHHGAWPEAHQYQHWPANYTHGRS